MDLSQHTGVDESGGAAGSQHGELPGARFRVEVEAANRVAIRDPRLALRCFNDGIDLRVKVFSGLAEKSAVQQKVLLVFQRRGIAAQAAETE